MKIKHNLEKKTIDTLKENGIVFSSFYNNKKTTYYHLPTWFEEDVDGNVFTFEFKDLPMTAQVTQIQMLKQQLDFISEEMNGYNAVMAAFAKGDIEKIIPFDFFNVAVGTEGKK